MKSRFPAFLDKHMADQYGPNQPSKLTKLDLQKLTDIHLYSHTDYEAEPNGDINTRLHFCCYCFIYFIDRLYQLHESFNSTFCVARKRNWHKKSSWAQEKRTDHSISQRISFDNMVSNYNCICAIIHYVALA